MLNTLKKGTKHLHRKRVRFGIQKSREDGVKKQLFHTFDFSAFFLNRKAMLVVVLC